MDPNGNNKVQALRQQFEGLTAAGEAPNSNDQQNHKKVPVSAITMNQTTRAGFKNSNHINKSGAVESGAVKTVRGKRNSEENMDPLLKSGNRYGFIAHSTSNPPKLLIPSPKKISSSNSTSVSSLSASPTSLASSPEEDNRVVGRSLSPQLNNNRGNRNGIYVSDPIIVFREEHRELNMDNGRTSGVNAQAKTTTISNDQMCISSDSDDSIGNNSAQYNKGHNNTSSVKRSNAFRQRDILDSPEPRFVRNSKLVLDRVKSLELPTVSNENLQRASARVSNQQQRPKSISAPVTKAVNVVIPYKVSDIYSPHQQPNRGSNNGQGTEAEPKTKETPEYAVPIPVADRSSSEVCPNYSKLPEPPKYPPPPPVHKSPNQFPMTRQYNSPYNNQPQHRYTTFGKNGNYDALVPSTATHDKRAANVCISNPAAKSGRPPPEKPPRTFLYDILSDQNVKNSANTRKSSVSASDTHQSAFYRQSRNGPNNQPKLAISTATIRQTTANATPTKATKHQQPVQHVRSSNAISNQHQTLVRSKTESQIVLKNNKLRGHHNGGVVGLDKLLLARDNNALVNHQSQLYLNQSWQQAQNGYFEGQYNLLSNTNLLQRLQKRAPSNPTAYPLRSESNLVLAGSRQEPPPPPTRMDINNIHSSKLGLPSSPLYSGGKEFRISRAHSNSLMFMNNLISMSYVGGAQGLPTANINRNLMHNSTSAAASAYSPRRTTLDSRHDYSNSLLLEKSKSEWALNRIGFNSSNSTHNVNNENYFITSSKSSSNIETVRMGTARRNTVAATNLLPQASIVTSSPAGSCTSTTGHPSLESNLSSVLASSSLSGGKSRPVFQQPVQSLVSQYFSPQQQPLSAASASTTSNSGQISAIVASSNNNNGSQNRQGTKEVTTSSTDSGIQLGSESLSSCDTPVGDSTTDTGDSDCENDPETINNARQVVEARKGYIRRVSSIRVQEIPSIHRVLQTSRKSGSGDNLFECLLVIGLNRDPYTGMYHPYIRDKFPPNAKVATGIEKFCFPDSLEWPCHEGPSAQSYTLAITDHRGARKYGCCYRILPEGADICIPIAYVIISAHRATGFYRDVLKEITQRHGYSEYQKRSLMEDLYKKQFPGPTEDITVTDPVQDEVYLPCNHPNINNNHLMPNEKGGFTQCYNNYLMSSPNTIVLRRKADQRLEECDLVTLLATLDLNTLIKLFGSLLLERKVVLISRSLNALSLCVEALESLLYPFSWQHTFIPILPLTVPDVLDAPSPFLIGCLRSLQTPWDKTLDEGIVIDLDQSKVLCSVGDEINILPKRLYRKLRNALQFVHNMPNQKESTKNVLTSECFIRMFVETLGHYSNHIVVQQDGKTLFEKDAFIKSSDSKATQNFLEWFTETAMFHEFIELRLKGSPPPGLFEQRILEQSELCPPINTNFASSQQQQNFFSSGRLGGSYANAGAGTPSAMKTNKFFKGTKPFGNWLREAFVK